MKKALLVGINKYPDSPLDGCVNDILEMERFLITEKKLKKENIRLLKDGKATKEKILELLKWLVGAVKKGDTILFHYSGHGTRIAIKNAGGSVERLLDAICPVDFNWSDDSRAITSDDFSSAFSSVPKEVEFTWISDSCHSGDLRRRKTERLTKIKTFPLPKHIKRIHQNAKKRGIKPIGFDEMTNTLNVGLIAGCKSDQTCGDVYFGKKANGVFTYYLLEDLNKPTSLRLPLLKLVAGINLIIAKNKFPQNPQLSGNKIFKSDPFL